MANPTIEIFRDYLLEQGWFIVRYAHHRFSCLSNPAFYEELPGNDGTFHNSIRYTKKHEVFDNSAYYLILHDDGRISYLGGKEPLKALIKKAGYTGPLRDLEIFKVGGDELYLTD